MATDKVSRRLAAIFVADMVGYSRLMEADEEGTIARQKAHRKELIDPKIAEHDGRIVKTTGDGMLVEFASVVDAVRCAVEVQQAMAEREADVPDDRRIRYRVGVNLGDIVIDGDDILGDGVNVAARLEGLSEAGGICISGAVFEQIESKLDVAFEDTGDQKVKNIAKPVRVYRLRRDGAERVEVDADDNDAMPTLELPDMPSIAVLPFDNMSGDPEQEYFADGIADDIITELSRFQWFFVIARNSSFTYKGRAVDVKQVARDLGVKYVLEGSVRKAGNRVRITAQLIDAETGNHLWAERYDRDLEDIFAIQDDIVQTIAGTLGYSVSEAERSRALRKAPANLDAYDHWLRAWALILRITKDENEESRGESEAAIAIDPSYALPYVTLAASYVVETFNGWTDDPVGSLERAREAARKAVSLNSTSDFGHQMLGSAELWLRNHDRAMVEMRRAVELNPNNADAHTWLATTLNFVGQPEQGLTAINTAKRLNPHYPDWYLHIESRSYFMLESYEDAIRLAEGVTTISPGYTIALAILAASYAASGQTEKAKAAVDKIVEIAAGFTLAYAPFAAPYKDPEDLSIFVKWLREAGLPE